MIPGLCADMVTLTHTRKQGRLYRYYVSQSVLKGGADDAPYRRLPAGEIEALVLDQLRALLRQPEVVVGTWRAAREEEADRGLSSDVFPAHAGMNRR